MELELELESKGMKLCVIEKLKLEGEYLEIIIKECILVQSYDWK